MPPKPLQLSPQEIEDIELAVDAAFLRLHGKTFRHAATAPHEQNGHHPDSVEQIRKDFPGLFGPQDDAA